MFSTYISRIVVEKIKMKLHKKMFWGENLYHREKFTIFKREVIHNLLSPLHGHKVVMRLLQIVEDTPIIINGKKLKKKNQ
jgi:hypothetical protein